MDAATAAILAPLKALKDQNRGSLCGLKWSGHTLDFLSAAWAGTANRIIAGDGQRQSCARPKKLPLACSKSDFRLPKSARLNVPSGRADLSQTGTCGVMKADSARKSQMSEKCRGRTYFYNLEMSRLANRSRRAV